ncbi:hypothetical protein [Clostridium estertheticum]|uniref:Uncharacterized protein n=1 Tax=Clostridium estertheticum TaxID=238834 RepID=A0AA47EK84_9CLOT|nr:hypothetical protein [Clostridium estertheticum]MBU3153502.1 hypothetical protein [Clostridium estertheticum]WAG60904.1 hypothetical protein LL038_01230 [Clostridium estertheticum]
MLDIKIWLETISIKVAEERFLKPPPLPYIIFMEGALVSGADDKNCIVDRDVSIELYSKLVDHESEAQIESLLNEKSIKYKKDRMWIDSETMFETTYDFNFVENF